MIDLFLKYVFNQRIESQYLHTESEPQANYLNTDTIFKVDPDDQHLIQVRINGYDRACHSGMSLETQLGFYKHFSELLKLVKHDKYVKKVSLKPGQVLIVNNWRVLHGRTAFNGHRIMSGCYINDNDFKSKCRTLGINIHH